MLKKILLVLAVLIAILVVVILTRPDKYHVERSATINAPAAAVFAQVSDLKNWAAWSPWEARDPNMKKSFEGTPGSVGHTQQWSGNSEVGKGTLAITAVKANTHVAFELEFVEPFASVADTAFEIQEKGGSCSVTWSMDGDNDFMGKAMSLFMDMDGMIGGDYEQGLANLKNVVEAGAAAK